MAFSISLLMALVLILSHPLTSISCDLPQSFDLGKQESFTALNQVVTISLSRLKYRTDFKFPRGAAGGRGVPGGSGHKAQLLRLRHLTNTFSRYLQSEFLTRLEACVMQEVGEGEAPLTNEDSILRNYFQRLSLYLQEKKYSPCAWEIVRAEIMRSLYSSTALQKRLRSEK
uniref:Uncharacterized protein n=1 Tax=Panthera tigris altaica TaxID=74533 RepID=A0A8C9JRY2_PANTA